MANVSFNSGNDSAEDKPLTTWVEIGFEHSVLEDERGRRLVYVLDDAGQKIPKRYEVPVTLTVKQAFDRSRVVTPDMVAQLGQGDMSSLLEVLDAIVGRNIVESVGTDLSVSTPDFVEFLTWLVESLKLTEIFGSPGN